MQAPTSRRAKFVRVMIPGTAMAVPLLALWVLLVGPWWHTWLDGLADQEYSTRVQAALQQVGATTATPTSSHIRVGASAVPLPTDSRDIPLAGYGHRAMFEGNAGVADPVFAKAIVVENANLRVAIVSPDLLIVNRWLAEMVLQRLQGNSDYAWTRQQLYFSATHTHSGPGGFAGSLPETLGLGFYDESLAGSIADALAECILQAERRLKPASFHAASRQLEGAEIRNRTMASDPTNRWLDVMVFRSAETSNVLATLTVFSAHATSHSSHDLRISADYPGVLCRHVEEQFGGVCLFLAGGVGSMGPANDVVPREQLANWMGTQLGKAAVELASESAKASTEPALAVTGGWVPLPAPAVKLGSLWRLSPYLASALLPAQTWVQALRLGDRILVGTPADYSGILAEELRPSCSGCTTIVTSFNGDYVGYILPNNYYDLEEYETKLCFFGPAFGGHFQASLHTLASMLADKHGNL